ncbi:hypothetical protein GF323_06405 [Candidatus Woesearchaeota archaeon]|nr:hypothetical protein [Candidatus Woesearchaeota archaeon]
MRKVLSDTMENMPVFVKIHKSRQVLSLLNFLRDKVNETRNIMHNLKNLHDEELAKIDEWKSKFELLNNKITNTNKNMLEPEKI